ncbi:hypothetical protein [Micromonospora okii]|uniref:hypothetical protein n=1 Tax=Micromonospora okii TaxID=1182970 RepID=UPI001E58BEE4|nr:hypothetical protein [Micromonospora okii]
MVKVVLGLFVYSLATIPVFLGLALVAQLTHAIWARRASEIVLLTGVAALIPVVLARAFEKPVLWAGVALLVVLLVGGVVKHARSYTRSS